MELNTTSYAILSLLAVRPWSTYELAQQMERSLSWFWPSAESVVYATPKELVRLGLATASSEYTGRRARTVYEISDDGRDALAEWMGREPRGPRLEWEGLLKVAFGDVGTRDQLLAVIAAMRSDADAGAREARERATEYLATGGPFPERLAVIALSGKFLLEWRELQARWTAWAEQAVAAWDGETRPIPDNAFRTGWRR